MGGEEIVLESEVHLTSFDKRGFVKTCVKPGSSIDLKHAIENSTFVKRISGESKHPMLVDIRNLEGISKEARDHYSMRNREPGITSIALLIDSPIGRIIGNFYMLISRPVVPTKLFTSETSAVSWLLKNAGHE